MLATFWPELNMSLLSALPRYVSLVNNWYSLLGPTKRKRSSFYFFSSSRFFPRLWLDSIDNREWLVREKVSVRIGLAWSDVRPFFVAWQIVLLTRETRARRESFHFSLLLWRKTTFKKSKQSYLLHNICVFNLLHITFCTSLSRVHRKYMQKKFFVHFVILLRDEKFCFLSPCRWSFVSTLCMCMQPLHSASIRGHFCQKCFAVFPS